MLQMNPNERKPEMIEKIMRAIQLVLDTFADYPLGPGPCFYWWSVSIEGHMQIFLTFQ